MEATGPGLLSKNFRALIKLSSMIGALIKMNGVPVMDGQGHLGETPL